VARFPFQNAADSRKFRRKLLDWFRFYKRDLPWRATRDPYRVWISEIMLQQTRVAVVVHRYNLFTQRFPTVEALAAAPLEDVLAAWSGLGYYRRARMMHMAAREVVTERAGELPTSSEAWRELPGIGRYTAAAIASIALNEPVAVVDGNVERVLLRLYGHPLKACELWAAAQALLSRRSPGDFNQAMMELGATICTPKAPACRKCPVHEDCATRGEHVTSPAPARIRRDVSYALATRGGKVALVQRDHCESLMPGMWELPPANVNGEPPLLTVKHAITSTDYTVRIYPDTPARLAVRWVQIPKLPLLPLTGLARKVLRRAGIIQ
jgi:A/G-specific adenine glycosylase